MAMSISDLPREVVALIMLLLPPEYLIEFKCLSKYWYSLISALIKDRAFVAKHLDNQKKNVSSTCLVICEDCNRNSCNKIDHSWYSHACFCDKFHLITKDDCDDDGELVQCGRQSFELPWRLHLHDFLHRVYHCDGLIFVADNWQLMAICNPAIKESRFLPQPCLPYLCFMTLEVGFGYDSKADDCSSWTKRLILDPLVTILCPLLIWKNEEVVMLRIDKSLVSYNIRTRKLRKIDTAGLEMSGCAFSYVKSLVSIKRKEQVGLGR
ncbi:hypothetical protein UlMin_032868 [Ulmus minor]